ncbi:MAG: carboxylating nicotinate-nucleotide diphosphorylase [Peptococcaceae bacterium]|nr:carboxylating nicotinate-nucleotide diphosphorylase [Peptococcaceae bacterium]
MGIDSLLLKEIITRALNEDIGTGDITTQSIIPENYVTTGFIQAKEKGVVAGLEVAREVFWRLCPDIFFQPRVKDGDQVEADQILARVEGDARSILTGERVALNFLQRMSGISTHTAYLVSLIKDNNAKLVDTRKTTPGLRVFEKYSVRIGGGFNHRFGLYDAILIKDNHIKVSGSVTAAITSARAMAPFSMGIEVEVETLEYLEEAITAGANIVMLDNMSYETMKKAVELAAGRVLLEASGGINEETIQAVAKTGVDFISVGSLTHHIKSLDISLDIGEVKPMTSLKFRPDEND